MNKNEFMKELEFWEHKYADEKLEVVVKRLVADIEKTLESKHPGASCDVRLELEALVWHVEQNRLYRHDMEQRLEWMKAKARV